MAKQEVQTISAKDVGKLSDVVELTPEEVAAKKEKAEQSRLLRNEAKGRLREFAKELPDDDSMKGDLLLIVGTGARARTGRSTISVNTVLRDLFLEKTEISEMEIFTNFKIGRPEMSIKSRIFVKVPDPADRIWVIFDEDKEVYRMIAKGAEVPKGWEGYVPVDENIL